MYTYAISIIIYYDHWWGAEPSKTIYHAHRMIDI